MERSSWLWRHRVLLGSGVVVAGVAAVVILAVMLPAGGHLERTPRGVRLLARPADGDTQLLVEVRGGGCDPISDPADRLQVITRENSRAISVEASALEYVSYGTRYCTLELVVEPRVLRLEHPVGDRAVLRLSHRRLEPIPVARDSGLGEIYRRIGRFTGRRA